MCNSLSDCFESLEKQVKFRSQFAIVSDNRELIFKTTNFTDCCDQYDVMNHVFDKPMPELIATYNISGIDITYQNIASMHDGTKLFCISIPDPSPVKKAEDSASLSRYCHDVQEPLRNISNFLQMIKIQLEPKTNGDVVTYIDYAIDNITILSKWTKKFLNKPQKDDDQSFKLHEVINQIRRLIAMQISRRPCRIVCDENISLEKCEYFEIMRVFKNLIENSIKHAEVEKLHINISSLSRTRKNVRILYEDNGRNLSKQIKCQFEKALKGEEGGLGLAICRDILKNNHGSIKLLKNRGGCAYEIKLPLSCKGLI